MLNVYVKEYLYYLKITKNLAKNTIISYERDLLEYLNFIEKNYPINDFRNIEVFQEEK